MSLLRRLRASQSERFSDLHPGQSAPSRHHEQPELGLIELGANVRHQRQRCCEIFGVDHILSRGDNAQGPIQSTARVAGSRGGAGAGRTVLAQLPEMICGSASSKSSTKVAGGRM